MVVYGKQIRFWLGPDGASDVTVDFTADRGLVPGTLVVDATPINRPTQGNIMQSLKAAQESIRFPFSVYSDAKNAPSDPTPVVVPIVKAGNEVPFEIADVDASGLPFAKGKAIMGPVSKEYNNEGILVLSSELYINSWDDSGTIA